MSRWVARVVGLLILIAFIVLMVNLQNRLEAVRQRRAATTSSSR
jgi:hypothetical protein